MDTLDKGKIQIFGRMERDGRIPIPSVEGGSVCWWRNETERVWRTGPCSEVIVLFPFPEFTNSKLKSGLYKVHHPILPPHKVVFYLLGCWYLKTRRRRGRAGTAL